MNYDFDPILSLFQKAILKEAQLLESFHSQNVEFIVVGAHALAFHGVPRFTGDLDLLVRPTDENARRILAALEEFGFTGSVDGTLGAQSVRFLGRRELLANKTATGRLKDRADLEALEAGQ